MSQLSTISFDLLDRRILGALRFVDATTNQTITTPVSIQSPADLKWARNSSGLHVAIRAAGMSDVTDSFSAPDDSVVPAKDFVLIVGDGAGRYVTRSVTVRMPLSAQPRQGVPAGQSTAPPVNSAIVVPLYPSGSSSRSPGWAIVRATVLQGNAPAGTTTAVRLPGALIRVLDQGTTNVRARGMADARGEALVAVPGLPVTTWSNASGGSVVSNQIALTLQAVFDPARPAVPDPDALDAMPANLKVSTVNLNLASGQTLVQNLFVNL